MTHLAIAGVVRREHMSEADFCQWLGQARVQEELIYHEGFLAREVGNDDDEKLRPDQRALLRLAARARWASEEGMVHLIQRRLGPDRFAYIAVARLKRVQKEGRS